MEAARAMPLKIACQMDPIDRIDIRGDSTFALLLEAQRRGHDILVASGATGVWCHSTRRPW